jgi:hypothetical protein
MIIESSTRADANIARRPMTADSRAQRHERAVAQTLRWAQEAAVSQSFDDALEWLQTVAIVDGPLSPDWQRMQASWRLLAAEQRASAQAPDIYTPESGERLGSGTCDALKVSESPSSAAIRRR